MVLSFSPSKPYLSLLFLCDFEWGNLFIQLLSLTHAPTQRAYTHTNRLALSLSTTSTSLLYFPETNNGKERKKVEEKEEKKRSNKYYPTFHCVSRWERESELSLESERKKKVVIPIYLSFYFSSSPFSYSRTSRISRANINFWNRFIRKWKVVPRDYKLWNISHFKYDTHLITFL